MGQVGHGSVVYKLTHLEHYLKLPGTTYSSQNSDKIPSPRLAVLAES